MRSLDDILPAPGIRPAAGALLPLILLAACCNQRSSFLDPGGPICT